MIRELIVGCLEDDPKSWQRVWSIVVSSLGAPTLRRLAAAGGDASLLEDAGQEFFLFLRADSCRRLRGFRGCEEGEFRGYIRAVARNFLLSLRSARLRAAAREAGLRETARPEAGGPSEPQVMAALREFEAAVPEGRRHQLRELLTPGSGPDGPEAASRTLRRWRAELMAIYAERVL